MPPKSHFVTEKPPVYEVRQVDEDDKESDWVVVNTADAGDVRQISNAQYKERFQRSRAKADPVPGVTPGGESPPPPDENSV